MADAAMADSLLSNSPIRSMVSGPALKPKPQDFVWNGKRCFGNSLHMAASRGDRREVRRLLESRPELLTSRFSCQTLTSPQWRELQNVEMSGEAIHLAATRGHFEIVKDLLAHRASLEANVERDGRAYCQVLHAALSFEDGQKEEMINFILSQTEMTCTDSGRHPLHLAAMSSRPELVCLVRHWMKKKGQTEADIAHQSQGLDAPLITAIKTAKLKLKDLVISAEPSTFALRIFMAECPEAIPLFLKRLEKLGLLTEVLKEAEITSEDVASLLLQSEAATSSLLDALTTRPSCRDEELYPLPSTVSFASRDYEQMFWNMLNRGTCSTDVFTALEPIDTWGEGDVGVRLHDILRDKSFGRPFRDAEIRVCSIPDLITPQLFVALASSEPKVFENRLVIYMIAHVFEHHAGKVELVACVVNLWILSLLNLHTLAQHEPSLPPQLMDVAVRFIAAQSLVDVGMEVIQIYGYAVIGQAHEYWQLENLIDFFFALIPLYLWMEPHNAPALVVTVFKYWGRVLIFASFCEPIGKALQPLTKIFRGLGPVLFLTVVAFASFSHAFFCLRHNLSLGDSIHGSFVTLITAGLPEEPSSSLLEAILLYASVTFFTVFILNIFIGVIGDEYSRLKEQCDLGFRQIRAKLCLEYMLRKQFFRIDWCSKRTSKVVMLSLLLLGLGIQWFSVTKGHDFANVEGIAYVLVLAGMHAVFYNSPGSHKLVKKNTLEEPSYFWFCCEAERAVEDGDMQEITFSY